MKRNIFLVLTGLETISVGFFLLIQRNILMDDANDKMMHFVHMMGNTQWSILLMAVGTFSLLIGLFNVNKWAMQNVTLIVLGGLWLAYAFSFTFTDVHFGKPIHLGDFLCCFIFIQILFEAYFGKRV